MIVLDTNVISELARRATDERVLAWVDHQDDLAVTDTIVAELLHGIARVPDGARRSRLAEGTRAIIDDELGSQPIVFDRAAASQYAEIVSTRDRIGRPIGIAEAQIAATCRDRGATLATRNVRDFEGVGMTVVDPWIAPIDSRQPAGRSPGRARGGHGSSCRLMKSAIPGTVNAIMPCPGG